MKLKGIDVSYCDKNIDWYKVKADGIEYAIIRAGYGRETSQKDVMFEKHYNGAKSVGMPVGAYWYSYAMSEADAIKEAKACIEIIKGKQFEYPIYFDIEESKQFALGKNVCSVMCKAFCDTLEKAGYWAGIYASASKLNGYMSSDIRNRYAIWVAHYTSADAPNYNSNYGMWQYTSRGQIDGITGVSGVDMDWCYVDYPTLIKSAKLNGFGDTQTNISLPTVSEGGGNVVMILNKLLGVSDDKYSVEAVRTFQLKNGLEVDGICGDATWSALLSK